MARQRLINCDFFGVSGFTKNLSNKAKLLYFFFLTNADDKGFVGNGLDIAQGLDQCEEDFENALFTYKYTDALNELVDKRLVYAFVDKCNNTTYLIRHWFLHNKNQKFLSTNYWTYLSKVELINNEYHLKTEEKKPYKEIKENKEINKLNELNEISNDSKETVNDIDDDETSLKEEWDKLVNEISNND